MKQKDFTELAFTKAIAIKKKERKLKYVAKRFWRSSLVSSAP